MMGRNMQFWHQTAGCTHLQVTPSSTGCDGKVSFVLASLRRFLMRTDPCNRHDTVQLIEDFDRLPYLLQQLPTEGPNCIPQLVQSLVYEALVLACDIWLVNKAGLVQIERQDFTQTPVRAHGFKKRGGVLEPQIALKPENLH